MRRIKSACLGNEPGQTRNRKFPQASTLSTYSEKRRAPFENTNYAANDISAAVSATAVNDAKPADGAAELAESVLPSKFRKECDRRGVTSIKIAVAPAFRRANEPDKQFISREYVLLAMRLGQR